MNEREFDYSANDFEVVRETLYQKAGINLSESKKQLVYSRLARRLRALKISSFSDYLVFMNGNTQEQEEFINALTTNLTAFFRESHHFDILAKHVETLKKEKGKLRVWCTASSTGEEPYSIAITLAEVFGRYDPPVEIIASDIDSNVLNEARSGVYPISRLDSVSLERKKQFFLRGKGRNESYARIVPELQKIIQFQKINLLDNSWPVKGFFDVIFCRNVMIYFDKSTQLRLLERMVKLLHKDGIYIAGHSESFSLAPHLVKLVAKTTYKIANSLDRDDDNGL